MSEFWKKELERATKEEGDWRKKATQVNKRYADERENAEVGKNTETRFNILWSTTETVRPALISAVPQPEIRQRYKKGDPIARVAATLLERAIEFSLDTYDFIGYGKKIANDFLLPGRGVTRVRYKPTFEKKKERIPLRMVEEGGETVFKLPNGANAEDFKSDNEGAFAEEEKEELIYEEVYAERVPWKFFRCDPADEWKNCRWVAFGAPYTKDEGIKEFGKKFEGVQIKNTATEGDSSEAMKNKIIVWEIWDKQTRKQIFIAEGHDLELDSEDDPLELEDFFPMPEPIYAVEVNDTMIPTPEFCLWQDQADELDVLSMRIRKVTEAIKARGAYAGEKKQELTEILTAQDNELIAVEDWMSMIDKGGLDGLISWVPIEQFAKVLQILETQRAIKVQEIFELTGVSDIQRGATDPRETAAAQELKANSGSRRLLTKQQAIQGHFRDVFRIKAEIIAEQFNPSTLKLMVGLESQNEVFDEAVAMIKNDALRIFNVDIETDTTIAADEEKDKRGLADALQAISGFIQSIGPMIQSGFISQEIAMGILQDCMRKFRFGRKLDELLEQAKQQPPPEDPAKAEQEAAAAAEQQAAEAELARKEKESQVKINETVKKLQASLAGMAKKMGFDQEKHAQEMRQDEEKHQQELRQQDEEHEQELDIAKDMAAVEAKSVEGQRESVN
jgi:hypothetical protein